MKLFILFLLVLSIFGCGSQEENNLSGSPALSGVINGNQVTEKTAASLGLVLIEFFRASSTPGELILTGFCSGTLVGRHTVLMAAHCFDPRLLPGLAVARVVFETERRDNINGLSLNVFKFTNHPLYNTQPGIRAAPRPSDAPSTFLSYDHDIAILVFKGTAPKNYQISKMASNLASDHAGETEHVYGFGRSADYSGEVGESVFHSTGVLREGSVQIKENFSTVSDRYYIQKNMKQQMICQGDSGGPHFLEGKNSNILIGVTSAALGRTLANGTKSCADEAQVTKVAPFYQWIKKEEKKLLEELNQEYQ